MNRFYNLLPQFGKELSVSAVAATKHYKKYGRYFRTQFDYLLSSTKEQQENRAKEELEQFLKSLKGKIPLYHIPEDLSLNGLPIIARAQVLENYDALLLESPYKVVRTSGTTGRSLAVPYNQRVYQHEYAFWWAYRGMRNVKQGDRIATFAGHKVVYIDRKKPPFWVLNRYENQLIFSSYHLSRENLKYYVEKLSQFKPALIHGYPSSIYLVAKHIRENRCVLGFAPKMIMSASETLLDFQRTAIEEAFSCKVHVWYGNTECCGHITECDLGRLHTQPLHSAVRVVDKEGRDVAPGEEGSLVATNFTNTCFPLINYDTRDRVVLSKNQTCDCGRPGIMLDAIIGRPFDQYVLTRDGRWVGRLDHLFKNADHVSNAQLEQSKIGELVVRIERQAGYTRSIENTIRTEAGKRLGKDTVILFDYVDEIPKDKNGKFSFVIQKLPVSL
ncbi:MAG: AMP-binding protein [Candidatus Eisenbacteria bacterium]|nr:AMP-binding protein [Candidatus Eisenbacteria bacterium]